MPFNGRGGSSPPSDTERQVASPAEQPPPAPVRLSTIDCPGGPLLVAPVEGRALSIDSVGVDVQELYQQRWHEMVRLAVLLVDDLASAEDVVQDAFIGLHRRQEQLRSRDAAVAYVRSSVLNGARSVLRKRRTVRRHLAAEAPMTEEPADDEALRSVERLSVMSAVRALPRRQREVLVLRYWSGLSEAEIAAALGISTGTVKSSASRGLASVQTTLKGKR